MREALAAQPRGRSPRRAPAPRSGRSSRPTPTATASSALRRPAARRRVRAARLRRKRHALRELGWRGPILLLEGCFDARDLETCSRLDLWHTVHHEAQIDWLAAHKTAGRTGLPQAQQRHEPARLHARAPIAPRGCVCDACRRSDEITLMTHFADADGADGADVERSARRASTPRRRAARRRARSATAPPPCASAAPAAARRLGAAGDHALRLVARPSAAPRRRFGPAPAMTLARRADRGAARWRPARRVGYGCRFTRRAARCAIGVVACGYADGYPRLAPRPGTPVLVDGVRTRTVGRVSMDMITVDLTPVPAARVGSIATLWGRADDATVLPIDEVAEAAGTVGYELMCALAPRVPVRVGGE